MFLSRFLPTWYEPKLHHVSFEFLKSQGINNVFCDLDNTLVAHHQDLPDERVKQIMHQIRAAGLIPCVISNNHESRVATFCEDLDVLYLSSTKKPRRSRLQAFMNDHGFFPEDSLIIGDQLLTDVWLANRLHCRSILVEPAVETDLLITKPNRFIDRIIRKYFRQKSLLRPLQPIKESDNYDE